MLSVMFSEILSSCEFEWTKFISCLKHILMASIATAHWRLTQTSHLYNTGWNILFAIAVNLCRERKYYFVCIWRWLLHSVFLSFILNLHSLNELRKNSDGYIDPYDDFSNFLRHYFRYPSKQEVKRGDDSTKAIRTSRERRRPLEGKRETSFTRTTQQVYRHEAFCNKRFDILYGFTWDLVCTSEIPNKVFCWQLGSWRTPYQAVCNRLQSLVIIHPRSDSLSANHVLRIWINRRHCLLASRDAFANNHSLLWLLYPQSTLSKLRSAEPY